MSNGIMNHLKKMMKVGNKIMLLVNMILCNKIISKMVENTKIGVNCGKWCQFGNALAHP